MLSSDRPATYFITCTPTGDVRVTVAPTADADSAAPSAPDLGTAEDVVESAYACMKEEATDFARPAGERDLDYVRRLMRETPDLELLLKEWNVRLHDVSLRELLAAKKFGQFKPRRRGQSRGGNGHLIPVVQIEWLLSLFDRVENHGETPPAWYRAVRSPSRWSRARAA